MLLGWQYIHNARDRLASPPICGLVYMRLGAHNSAVRESSLEKADHYYAADRAAWRVWLKRNHATSHGVWLVYDKAGAGKRRLLYDDIVDEAVSFGWIDSRSRSLNAERAMLYLSPRKRKSPWARSNKERVARLVKQGLMTDAGLAVVEAAKKDVQRLGAKTPLPRLQLYGLSGMAK